MEGDGIGTGGNLSDISISFPESPEKHLQVQSSADDEEDDEEELATPKEAADSDDPIINLHLEIETLRRERLDLQRRLASSAADFKDELSRMEQTLILASSEAENARAEADAAKKVLGDQKSDLEERVRYLEGQLSDLKMVKESEADGFMKKEGELRLVIEELNMKAEKARVALVKKEEETNTLMEWKEEVEAEKERRSCSVAKENEVVISLEEKLMIMREKVEELAAERQKIRLDMKKKEDLIASLTEELRIAREKERDVLEIEKKFAVAMADKEDEIVTLKKDLMLVNEKREFENNKLEEELRQRKDEVSYLEERIKKILSKNEDGGILQNRHMVEQKKVEHGLKFSWVTTAAIMASTGTAAATITAFCLRHNKHG